MIGSRLKGVKVPHMKNTAGSVPRVIDTPKTVTIPMSMHIGAPATPVVKVGETVKVGQLIAEAGGFVSSPIYASVSGKVKKLDDILVSSGRFVKAIVIEADGAQEPWEGIAPPEVTDFQSFIDAVKKSGVVGLGGAGFPTAVKLSVKDLNQVEAFIINGAECEPYVTSDTRTMLDDTDLLWDGVQLLKKYMNAKRIIFGIENNKPECVKKIEPFAQKEAIVEVQKLPPMYPQGGEKVLIYNTIGKTVPEGKLPLDVGAIVLNCTTLAAIARYIKTGMPLVSKCVTVDGSAVAEPQNVIAPIGTPMADLFNFCGGFKSEPKKLLYGGPMMGIAVPNVNVPILKNTNAILALDAKDAVTPAPTACIRCGTCVDVCPLGLMPAEIEVAFRQKDAASLDKLKVNLCMECGSCAFACPARRPLVQTNKLAKSMLSAYKAVQKAEAERKAAKNKEEEAVK